MISKLCAWSKNRDLTIDLLNTAINSFEIEGIKNNLSFLSVILMNKSFRKGNFSTKFLKKEYPNAYQNYSLNNAELQKLSAAVLALYKNY